MSTFLEELAALHGLGKLQCVLSHLWAKELWGANCHDRDRQLPLSELDVELAVFEAGPVSLEDATQAARLLDTFDPVVERFWLDIGRVVAFLLDEHLNIDVLVVNVPRS